MHRKRTLHHTLKHMCIHTCAHARIFLTQQAGPTAPHAAHLSFTGRQRGRARHAQLRRGSSWRRQPAACPPVSNATMWAPMPPSELRHLTYPKPRCNRPNGRPRPTALRATPAPACSSQRLPAWRLPARPQMAPSLARCFRLPPRRHWPRGARSASVPRGSSTRRCPIICAPARPLAHPPRSPPRPPAAPRPAIRLTARWAQPACPWVYLVGWRGDGATLLVEAGSEVSARSRGADRHVRGSKLQPKGPGARKNDRRSLDQSRTGELRPKLVDMPPSSSKSL